MSSEVAQLLRRSSLTDNLSLEEIERLSQVGSIERWSAEEVLIEEGSTGPRLLVLLRGNVEVVKQAGDGSSHVLATLSEGSVLGEMSLLQDAPRSATVRAISSVAAFSMDRQTFQEMLDRGDSIAYKLSYRIARVLARRVDELNRRVVQLIVDRVPEPTEELKRIREEIFTRWDF